jgi:hypothetical protein
LQDPKIENLGPSRRHNYKTITGTSISVAEMAVFWEILIDEKFHGFRANK